MNLQVQPLKNKVLSNTNLKDYQLEHEVSSLDANDSFDFKCTAAVLTELDSCIPCFTSSFVDINLSKFQKPPLKVP